MPRQKASYRIVLRNKRGGFATPRNAASYEIFYGTGTRARKILEKTVFKPSLTTIVKRREFLERVVKKIEVEKQKTLAARRKKVTPPPAPAPASTPRPRPRPRPESTPRQIKRPLQRGEKIVVVDKNGRKVGFRSDRQRVLQIVDEKTGKVKGYVNTVKDGKPVPRNFSSGQFARFSVQRTGPEALKPKKVKDRKAASALKFRVSSAKGMIVDQIPNKAVKTLLEVAKQSATDEVIFDLFINNEINQATRGAVIGADWDIKRVKMDMVLSMLEVLKALEYRMSPKKTARFKTHKHIPNISVEIRILSS